jgi:ubiquinone/menaquinone biosynthesis C-methylase UbiE
MSDGTEAFSSLADDYARYRPGYPIGVLDKLIRECGLTQDWMVADIGSGTGNLAHLFLEADNQVIGVEPNCRMREAGERLLAAYPNFKSLDGTAECIPINTHSVDLITIGQALHWFDVDRAKAEFQRILRPGGWVAVLWNDRLADTTAFTQQYASLTNTIGVSEPLLRKILSFSSGLDYLFCNAVPYHASFPHTQCFDLECFLGRARSSGYIPQPGEPGYDELTTKMTDLFTRYQCNGTVEFYYDTQLYFGHLE